MIDRLALFVATVYMDSAVLIATLPVFNKKLYNQKILTKSNSN